MIKTRCWCTVQNLNLKKLVIVIHQIYGIARIKQRSGRIVNTSDKRLSSISSGLCSEFILIFDFNLYEVDKIKDHSIPGFGITDLATDRHSIQRNRYLQTLGLLGLKQKNSVTIRCKKLLAITFCYRVR